MAEERLNVILSLITGNYKKEAKEAAAATGQIGTAAGRAGAGVGGFREQLNRAGPVIGLVGVGAVLAMAKAAGENADRLFDLQAQTGANTQTLQEYEFVAKAAGASNEFFADSVKQVIKGLDGALAGTGAQADAYDQLGISVTDASGKVRAGADITEEVIAKLAGMANVTERNGLAQDIFGKKWEETVSVLDLGTEAIEKLKNEAQEMGAVVSEASLVGADRLRESLAKLQAQVMGGITEGIGLLALGIGRAFGDEVSRDALNFVEALKLIDREIAAGADPLTTFANALFHAAEGGKVTTEELNQLASAAGFALDQMSGDELRAFALSLEEQAIAAGANELATTRAGSAFRVLAAEADAGAGKIDIHSDALRLHTPAVEADERATRAAVTAQLNLNDAMLAAASPTFALAEAANASADAHKSYVEAVREFGIGSEEAEGAALNLGEAEIRLDAASKKFALEGGQQGIDALVEILTQARVAKKDIDLIVASIEGLNATPITAKTFPFAAPRSDALRGARAAGGRVAAGGMYVVGEGGAELFKPDRPGLILSHSQSVAAVRTAAFDQGGVVRARRGEPVLAIVHGGETILPTHKMSLPEFDSGGIVGGISQSLIRQGGLPAGWNRPNVSINVNTPMNDFRTDLMYATVMATVTTMVEAVA